MIAIGVNLLNIGLPTIAQIKAHNVYFNGRPISLSGQLTWTMLTWFFQVGDPIGKGVKVQGAYLERSQHHY